LLFLPVIPEGNLLLPLPLLLPLLSLLLLSLPLLLLFLFLPVIPEGNLLLPSEKVHKSAQKAPGNIHIKQYKSTI